METTVAEWIIGQLKAWGVQNIYGLAGDAILPLVDCLSHDPSLHFYSVKHETSAAFMASAEGKLSGKLGVCIATSGPGTANLVNGLADAKNDRIPVLAITGQVESFKLSTDTKQYVDQGLLLQAAVDYSGLVVHAQACEGIFTKAIRTAIALGTAVHVSVAKDVWTQPLTAPIHPPEPYLQTPHRSPESVFADLITRLNQAERPAILAGRGVRRLGSALMTIAEKWQCGICLTLPAKGCIAGDHPLVLGGIGEGGSEASTRLLESADTILVAGATWWPKQFVPPLSQVIQIDSTPLNIGRNTPVAYGAVGDLTELLPYIAAHIQTREKPDWVNQIHSLKKTWLEQIMTEIDPSASPISPAFLIHSIEKTLGNNATICLDVGDHTVWFNRIFAGSGEEILLSGHWRSMGFGLPAALAAKLINPARQVIAIVGDGGFAQSMAEFLTAVRYQIPVTVVIVNNGWLAMEKDKMDLQQLNYEVLSLTNPDFAKFAEICGGKGFNVTQSDHLEETLRAAYACGQPAIVNVQTAAPLFPGLKAKAEKSRN